MTRAKERLVLSGALTGRSGPGNFLSLLREAIGEPVGDQEVSELAVGEGRIAQTILAADEGRPRERVAKVRASWSGDDLQDIEAHRRTRTERWEHSRQRPVFLTPSKLEEFSPGQTETTAPSAAPARAVAVGTLVHKMLEGWNYRDKIEVLLEQFNRNSPCWQTEGFQGDFEEVLTEAREILTTFTSSEAYAELCDVTILGREVPFMMLWDNGPPPTLMEGRIDLLYEKDGQVWVADYKTDRIVESEMAGRAETYQPQARIYTEAVRQTLGRTPAGFTLIFLRLGKAVPFAYIDPAR